ARGGIVAACRLHPVPVERAPYHVLIIELRRARRREELDGVEARLGRAKHVVGGVLGLALPAQLDAIFEIALARAEVEWCRARGDALLGERRLVDVPARAIGRAELDLHLTKLTRGKLHAACG